MKLNIIYLITFCIFTISIYNIFYKANIYTLFNLNKKSSKFLELPSVLYSDGKLFCSITGYKCKDETCDCKSICNTQYNKFKIYPGENIVMFNEQLLPGTYCLPKGFEYCNVKTSIPIYSISGWICISKNPSIYDTNTIIACKNAYATDNSKNYLIDLKEHKEITMESVNDFYEKYNGEMRYQCACNSTDRAGNLLINLKDIPFKCLSDYCLSKLYSIRGIPGWNNITKQCDCGHLSHQNPNDLTSHCINAEIEMKGNIVTNVAYCTNETSIINYPIVCNSNNNTGTLNFSNIMHFSDDPLDYLNTII